jgi:hypothetical protein
MSVERIATYALSREKREKTITRHWDLSRGRLIKATFNALNEFIAANVGYIVGLPEILPDSGIPQRDSVFKLPLSGRLPRKPAQVVEFKKQGERSATVRKLVDASDVAFFDLSEKVARWFRDALFWPKTYLFVAQTTITRGRSPWRVVGILATKLEYGEFAEDAEKIVEQMQRGVIRKKIKKGMVYPHYTQENGHVVRRNSVKVFEAQSRPANYFYQFLGLKPPVYAQQVALARYEKMAPKMKSVDRLVTELEKEGTSVLDQVYVTIELNEARIKCRLSALGNTAKLGHAGSRYAALIFGTKARVMLGNHDLLAEDKIPLVSAYELVQELHTKNIEENRSGFHDSQSRPVDT